VGNLNHDGKLDLVVGYHRRDGSPGPCDGTFQPPILFRFSKARVLPFWRRWQDGDDIFVADFTQDGKPVS